MAYFIVFGMVRLFVAFLDLLCAFRCSLPVCIQTNPARSISDILLPVSRGVSADLSWDRKNRVGILSDTDPAVCCKWF